MLTPTQALAKLRATQPRQTRKARKRSIGAKVLLLEAKTLDHGVQVPLRLISEANVSQREHWAVKHKRVKRTREAVRDTLRGYAAERPTLPCTITITRIAPRSLDSFENLPRSMKAVADEVAAWLGVDDADPRVQWRAEQERGAPRTYGVRISWEPYEERPMFDDRRRG